MPVCVVLGRLGHAAEDSFDLKRPLFEEPFGEIHAISLLPTPQLQLRRLRLVCFRQSQLLDLVLEHGLDGGSRSQRLTPVAASALRHGPRPYATPLGLEIVGSLSSLPFGESSPTKQVALPDKIGPLSGVARLRSTIPTELIWC